MKNELMKEGRNEMKDNLKMKKRPGSKAVQNRFENLEAAKLKTIEGEGLYGIMKV